MLDVLPTALLSALQSRQHQVVDPALFLQAQPVASADDTSCLCLQQAALQSTVGLGPITLAALSSTTDPTTGLPVEWIKEDDLADMINMHPKILRRALRYLEQVRKPCVASC